MSKEIKARVQQKHGTKAEWDRATSFVPLKGELIVYTDIGQFKVGDGTTSVVNLPFKDREYEDREIEDIYNSVR